MAQVPPDIRVCINKLVPFPIAQKGEMTRAQVVRLITALRQSEVAKTYCGRRLLALYDAQGN